MAITKVRVPGGGNTFMIMGINQGTRLAFLANVNDQPGRAVGNATPIHPIGSPYPVDIATPYAQGAGTLTLTVWSTWGEDGWVSAFQNDDAKSPWKGYNSPHSDFKGRPVDLREVFEAQREKLGDGYILAQKYELGSNGKVCRVKTYHKCIVTDIDATDNVSIETMEQRVRITCMYTYVTVAKSGAQSLTNPRYINSSGKDFYSDGTSNSGV